VGVEPLQVACQNRPVPDRTAAPLNGPPVRADQAFLKINRLSVITHEVVEAARSTLIIGAT
jgi:hypothetical protein